jgi:hypothetical protein
LKNQWKLNTCKSQDWTAEILPKVLVCSNGGCIMCSWKQTSISYLCRRSSACVKITLNFRICHFASFLYVGNFLYTESVRNGSPEDFADITSKIYTLHRDREQCLSFSHSVYGHDESTLGVYIKDSNTDRLSRPLTITSNLHGLWEKAMVTIYPENQFQVM